LCGRANRNGECYVPWHGEKLFKNFEYVLGNPESDHLKKDSENVQGYRLHGDVGSWCAIAYTPWGKIPGVNHLFWHPECCLYLY
jgi:hypothetical protein